MTNVYGSAKNIHSILLLLCHLTDGLGEQWIVPNLLSVEQMRSPHILPESRALKTLSPQNCPIIRAEILLQSPHEVPIFPHISPGYPPPPSGEPMTNALVGN